MTPEEFEQAEREACDEATQCIADMFAHEVGLPAGSFKAQGMYIIIRREHVEGILLGWIEKRETDEKEICSLLEHSGVQCGKCAWCKANFKSGTPPDWVAPLSGNGD